MKATGYRFLTGICVLLCVIAVCFTVPASAADGTGTLSLWCVREQDVLAGMHWRIYRVGHRTANDYVFEGTYAGYRLTLGNRSQPMLKWDAETVAAAAETLRIYTVLDHIPYLSEGDTDAQGNLCFSGLEDGLYLVTGDKLEKGIKTYIPSAIFFEMDHTKDNVLNAMPKIIYLTLDNDEEKYSVRKIWENAGNQTPDLNVYITCELYRDGELQQTVRLDSSNDWNYEWNDQPGHIWMVREQEIPPDYTVMYRNQDTQFLIVNTYDGTGWNTTTVPGTTTTTHTGSTVTTAETPKLPQTGQLWWPVPFLSIGGLTLIAVGVRLRRKDSDA